MFRSIRNAYRRWAIRQAGRAVNGQIVAAVKPCGCCVLIGFECGHVAVVPKALLVRVGASLDQIISHTPGDTEAPEPCRL